MDAEELYYRMADAARDALGWAHDADLGDADDHLAAFCEAMVKVDTEADEDDRGPNRRFQMYTRDGNDQLAGVLEAVKATAIKDGMFRHQIIEDLRARLRLMKMGPNTEWSDTEPRGMIVREMNAWLDEHGFKAITEDDLY